MKSIEGINELAKTLGSTTQDIYEDGIKETVQETGKIVSRLPRTINALFANYDIWLLNREHNVAETKKLLESKLKNIPEDKITDPEPYIAIPTIQALSYSMNSEELREMYANLLASSMVTDTKDNTHPSFVEIIKQLSPDEAKLIKIIAKKDKIPFIDIRLMLSEEAGVKKVTYFTDIGFSTPNNPSKVIEYWNNLERLKIIEIPLYTQLTDEKLYKHLEKNPAIVSYLKEQENPEKHEFQRGVIKLTHYGRSFIKCCVI